MRSGDARLMRIASKSAVSWALSCVVGLIVRFPLRHYGIGRLGLRLLRRRLVAALGPARLEQLDVEAERLQLADEHVERFGQSGLERRVALDDRLVNLRPARHVVGLGREQLLQDVGGAVGLERPDLHLAEALAAELRLAAERLL